MPNVLRDLTNIFPLIVGFVAGSIICKFYLDTRSYAADSTQGTVVKLGLLINCDEPFMVSQRDWKYLKQVDPDTRKKTIAKLKKQYESVCKAERIRRAHDDSINPNLPDPNYLTDDKGHVTMKPETGLTVVPDITSTFARSYAGLDDFAPILTRKPLWNVINCDKPRPWTRDEIDEVSSISPYKRREYLINRERVFKRICRDAARERNQENLEQSDPEQTNLKYGLKFPDTAQGKFITRPLYPSVDSTLSDINQATYARSYQAYKSDFARMTIA